MDNTIEKELSRKEAILKVTLDIIMAEGFEGVTIRKIASRAGVNIALINYHFGSKENLISESLKILTTHFRNAFVELDDQSIPPLERLEVFFNNYIGMALQYTEVVKRIFLSQSLMFQSQSEFLDYLKSIGISKIHHAISEITGETDPAKLMTMMIQVMGSIVFPILTFPELRKILGLEAPYNKGIENYIKTLLHNYFSKYINK